VAGRQKKKVKYLGELKNNDESDNFKLIKK
jgi:hypothetical protein